MKHLYIHKFQQRKVLDHRVKHVTCVKSLKTSLPLLNFKTGHVALRREGNIVDFLGGVLTNLAELSFAYKKKTKHSFELYLSSGVFKRCTFNPEMQDLCLENHLIR